MRRFGIALIASLLSGHALTACSPTPAERDNEQKSEPHTGQFELGSYEIDPETGETRAVVNNEDGTTTMRAGKRVVPRLPEGFSLYPGAVVRNTIQVGRAEATGVMVSLASEDRPTDLVQFYRRQAEAAGVAIELDLQTEDSAMIAGEGPDGTSFVFQASGQTGETEETTGQLTVRRGLN